MGAQVKPQLKNLRAFVGKLDSGRSDISTRYKEVLRGDALSNKHRKLAKSPKK